MQSAEATSMWEKTLMSDNTNVKLKKLIVSLQLQASNLVSSAAALGMTSISKSKVDDFREEIH